MDYETWKQEYRPIKNPVTRNTALEGCVFLPYSAEFELVRAAPKLNVWSFIISDEEDAEPVWLISEGLQVVNTFGYLITEKPFDPNQFYAIRY